MEPDSTLITAYVAVSLGDEHWEEHVDESTLPMEQDLILQLFSESPPSLAEVDTKESEWGTYGFHKRYRSIQNFIYVRKFYVDQWRFLLSRAPNRKLTLDLESLLYSTFIHEIAHWMMTKVVWPLILS
jgi:hypothetical protein